MNFVAPSGERMMARCDELARCSAEPDALTRIFLSPEQHAANELVLGWMRDAGMDARLDAIGNVVGRYEGEIPGLPCLMLGSHLDTVRNAGKYDGMLGVISAIECVDVLHRKGRRLPFAVEVAGFSDEEGVRFSATLLGSRAIAGTFDQSLLTRADADGMTMADALTHFGLNPANIGSAARRRDEILAYAELHIEQGPVLEAENLPVGVVTAINGASRFQIEIKGLAGHAGTVPMSLRQDALAAAAEAILAIESHCGAESDLVGTVGRIEAAPGATNVIPGLARFTLDLRAPSDSQRLIAAVALREKIAAICTRRNVAHTMTQIHEGATAACAPWLQQQIAAAIAAEGVPVRHLPSGAGHDGMAMIALADIGMLFVRCKAGISHNPLEAISCEDAALSARVFLRFIEQFQPR